MSSSKFGETDARRAVAHISLSGTTQLHLRNPFVIAAWSIAFPGMGHLLLSKYWRGYVLFLWEVFVNYKANIIECIESQSQLETIKDMLWENQALGVRKLDIDNT